MQISDETLMALADDELDPQTARQLRDAIAAGNLAGFVAAFHAQRAEGDIDPL